jgi:hypothetical protein
VLYEYRHNSPRKRGCPKQFELIRAVAQRDESAPCPKCGSTKTERLKFQAFAIAGISEPDIVSGDTEMEDFDDDYDGDFGF